MASFAHRARLAWPVLILLASATPSCTWLVYDDLEGAAKVCSGAGDCFAGQACVKGSCTFVDGGGPPGAPGPETVGPDGGVILGPDGARLIIPAGALADEAEVRLVHASASISPVGFVSVSRFYSVITTTSFSPSATLEIPLDDASCEGDTPCLVYERTADGAFASLPAVIASSDLATALVEAAGTFGAGHANPAVDAGVTDASALVDGGASDGGEADAGPPAFAACDLSAAGCSGEEACAADPFDETRASGTCVRSCAADAGDELGCGCCGAVSGWSGSWCLPDAWCGAGDIGDACPNGTADCDPGRTDACADLGVGPVCTSRCDGTGQCDSGCCVGAPGGGSYCAAASSCGALSNGALCFDDATCASGRCESHDGVSPRRCTEACAPGSCGDGLCCYPTSCAGEWLCVLEAECAEADTLICGDICLSDEACEPGDVCVDAACTPSP